MGPGLPYCSANPQGAVRPSRGSFRSPMWNMDRAAVADLIAVQEGRSPVPLLDDDAVLELLRSRPRIAMIGASANPARAANGVLRNLRRAGYHVVAVNPTTTVIEDEPCYPTLADAVAATGPVDLVDVFRRPDQCVAHAHEAVAAGRALPVAPAGHRQRRGGADRPRRRARGRDGPLHEHRALAARDLGPAPRALNPRPARASPIRSMPSVPPLRRSSCRRSTFTPSPATTRPSCSCRATPTGRPGSRNGSTAASRRHRSWSRRTAASSATRARSTASRSRSRRR